MGRDGCFALTIQELLPCPQPRKVVTGAWVTNAGRRHRSAPTYDEHYHPLKYGDIVNLLDEHDIRDLVRGAHADDQECRRASTLTRTAIAWRIGRSWLMD